MRDERGAQRRALIYLYEDAKTERLTVVDGLTTDANLIRLYETAVELHADAWVLQRAGMLPDWWRLVYEIRAEHLTDQGRGRPTYRVTWPMSDAALRIVGLTADELIHHVQSYRVMRTSALAGEGRIHRVRESRTTGTLRQGRPDRTIHHPEAFTDDPQRATVHGVGPIEIERVPVHVAGPHVLLPSRR
jgi:hypothetical protein